MMSFEADRPKSKGRSRPAKVFNPAEIPAQFRVSPRSRAKQDILVKIIFNKASSSEGGLTDIARAISAGFPTGAVLRLVEYLNVTQKDMLELLSITTATFNRRKEKGTLQSIESDRVYRYTRLAGLATTMFHGDVVAARRWLKAPAYAFNGTTPLEHARTEFGAREVENLIGRIRHGIPS